MKTVKAYIHVASTKLVVKKLEEASIENIMIEKVDEIVEWKNQEADIYSLEYSEKYTHMNKIEFFCNDLFLDKAIEIIQKYSKTGAEDEGVIFVQTVDKVIRLSSKTNNDFIKP